MFWILLFLSIITIVILYHQDFTQFIQKKIGLLEPIEAWSVSFKKKSRLIISITGIKLHLISKPVRNKKKKKKKRRIPLVGLIRFIFRYIQINIEDVVITKDDMFELSLDYLSIQQQGQKIVTKLGPLQLFHQDLTLVDMITSSTLSCEIKQNINIEFELGKFLIYADNCMKLASTRKRSPPSSSSSSFDVTQVLNSMRVTIDSIRFIHTTHQFDCTINQIVLNTLEDQTPLVKLKAKSFSITNSAIQCSIPSLEVMVDRAVHSVAPYTQFISVTCIFNSAHVNLSLHELKLFQTSSSSSSASPKEEPKVFKNLPVCALAVVLNSPELNISLNDEIEKIGAGSLIIRVSGEYVPKGSDEVASASSTGSSSHLDALISQEEYRLQTSHRMQLTTKWKQWMNRVQQQQGTQQWSYRVSSKIMIHKLSIGKEFLNIKHAVSILNIRLVVEKKEIEWYETMMVVEQGILQSEVSVDQPVVSLWNDDEEENTSLFWVATLPNYLRKKKSKSPATVVTTNTEKRKLIQYVNFSLEVNEGSIYVCSVDKAINNETVPDGYIDNKPKENVYSKIELTTKKFNLVCSNIDWQIRCLLESLKVEQSSGAQVREMMVCVSQLDLVLKQNHAVCKLKKYGIIFSVQHLYVCLLLVKSLIQMKQHFPKKEKKKQEKVPVHLDLSVARGDIHLLLPNEKELYLRLDQLVVERKVDLLIKFRNMMLLGQSPLSESCWEQLIEFDQAQISVKNRQLIEFKARKLFVRVPYNYILNTVTENVIGSIKAAKELHARILSGKTFTYFGPTCKNLPVLIPCIHIKTHVFSLQFDDDPFESKLRNILRTGLLEQQKRLAYEDALQEKIQTMLSTPEYTDETSSSTPADSPDLIEVHAQIAEAQKNLLHHHSQLWIKNINDQTQQEQQYYYDLHLRNYRNSMHEGEDDILDESQRPEFSLFLIDILPLPLYPPLAHFCSQFVKISFKPADFPLDETRQFVHTIGGGVPLSNNFSALVPFHLSIKAGQTWIKVRDYPLPLLYVPSPRGMSVTTMDDASSTKSRNQSRVSWCLEGNYVFGDEMGASCGSRIIPVSVIPNGYTLSVVRTASPVKFYSVVDYHILTSSMSTLCWSISYSPSIQDIARVLETIMSKPKDPSSRLGFWDKVRFIIHTQTKLRFIGGGDLALVVKGTRDPYKLQGTGAGLTKIWSDEVVWLLGYDNPEHEFMQIVSKQYAFGVPDLVRGGFVPSLPGAFERKKPVGLKEEYNRFLKVVLKLTDGVRMGIGLAFERFGCNRCEKCQVAHRLNRCRTHSFSPHYNVLFRSFKHVEMFYDNETYDSYHGFRSDFVHLSLSIIKLNQASNVPSCQNAMYISPCFNEHFTSWYRLLGSPISIPMRRGNLFPRAQEKSKSFGEHLNTIKYKFVIKPLAIGFFCTDEETYMNVKGGGAAGLKATVVEFNVDIHQRREINKVDPSAKASMTFHELEVKLRDIDLRVIKASHLSRSREKQEHQLFQWVDARDFVILDSVSYARQNQLPYKKIDVYPFAFSPLFYFVRQNDEGETNSRHYLRSTHDCGIGKGMDSHEFQKAHLQRRASDLDRVIEEHDKQLDIILDAMQTMKPYSKDILDQHAALTEKLNYLSQSRYMLHTYLGQLILETELNMSDRDSPHTTTSSLGRRDELNRWETLMGPFQDRFFIHNPQIIWNNSVRDAVYYWHDIKSHRSVQIYNLSSRCLKFLQDLVDNAKKQQAWKPDVPLTEEKTQDMTQDLIDKLLSERLHNYVAYNETEEDEPPEPAYDTVFESSEENVNDPDYQYKSIPDSYEMKSKYLVDMINPQVNFQSDKGLDHLILFTNERILVKAFEIIDTCNNEAADKDVRLVKGRILVALDNAQLLVAKRIKDTKSTDGQSKNMHWAAWVQPEQLWYYRDAKYFDNFQRVASQLSGTVQLDRYNHLRIKINKYDSSRKSLFEDRTNTFELHFPQFKLVLNSQQAQVLYYTLINLLLGNEGSSSKKERLSKFKDVMLAAERSDLAETVKQVGVLQNRSRVLLALHKKFMHALPRLDSHGIREFNRNRKKMRENLEKLYLVVEAIRCIQTFRRDIHLEETDHAMRFSFTSDEIVWEALLNDDNDIKNTNSLCKWMLVNTKFVMLSKQNGSKRSTIEIERMQIMNTTDNPVFTNVLEAFVLQGQEVDFSRQKMLRGVLESLPPVGGIPIVQQLEINLMPLHLQISTAFGTIMKDYFFPRIVPDESQVQVETDESEESDDEYEDDDDDDADMISLEVASGTASKIDTLSSTQSSERPLNRTLSRREGSFASFDLLTKKVKDTVIGKKKAKSDELTVMKNRSSTNRTFLYIRIPATKHCLSLRGPTQNTFYNMYNFPFKLPNLEYRNMTWSIAEMMEEIQKQFLRAALRHSPAFLKNKLMLNNKQPAPSTTTAMTTITPTRSRRPSVSSKSESITQRSRRPSNTTRSSYNTEEEDNNDVKSLHSNDNADDELHRLIELQAVDKRISFNVDQELLDVYMKQYKPEEEKVNESVRKGRILFGESYDGFYYSADTAAAAAAEIKTRVPPNKSRTL